MRKLPVLNIFFLCLMLFHSAVSAELVVIVHPENLADNLTQQEVSQIFLGRTLMFPNTKDRAQVLDQDKNSAIFEAFYMKLVKLSVIKVRRYRAAYTFSGRGALPTHLNDGSEVKNSVANNPNAIGYTDAKLVDSSVKVVFTLP